MKVKIKRVHENAVIPQYAKHGDAAMDIVCVSKEVFDNHIEYKTGLAFEVPEGYVMLMYPRSSTAKTDMILGNCVGVLDSGYRGELKIIYKKFGEKVYDVGDRVVQVMIIPYPKIEFEEAEELSQTERGEGSFGSSGGTSCL